MYNDEPTDSAHETRHHMGGNHNHEMTSRTDCVLSIDRDGSISVD